MFRSLLFSKQSLLRGGALGAIAALLVAASVAPASAATHTVNGALGDTIQGTLNAMTAANNGDVVFVEPGNYFEDIVFPTTVGITLRSRLPGQATITGSGSTTVVRFFNLDLHGTVSTIQGFKIKGGSAMRGGGISCIRSSVSILNNEIFDNDAAEEGGGIYTQDSGAVICQNTIRTNTSAGFGGGVASVTTMGNNPPDRHLPIVDNNQIRHNTATKGGGGIYAKGEEAASSVWITSNSIHFNHVALSAADVGLLGVRGGGVLVEMKNCPDSTLISDNNVGCNTAFDFSGTTTAQGGGIFCRDHLGANNTGVGARIQRNEIYLNEADEGGGIYCEVTHDFVIFAILKADLRDNKISFNTAHTFGGGIYATTDDSIGEVHVHNNNIFENTAPDGGGGIYAYGDTDISSCTITCNRVTAGLGKGGGVWMNNIAGAILNSIIFYNTSATHPQLFAAQSSVLFSNIDMGAGAVAWPGGIPGLGNINADPLFVGGNTCGGLLGQVQLSQVAGGQGVDSPCVNTGFGQATGTTASNLVPDTLVADIGYHYPLERHQVFLRGDANGDLSVDLADPVMILLSLFAFGALPLPCDKAADGNDDDVVNIADAIFLLTFLFANGPPPEHPFPCCGSDAESPLSCDQGCPTQPTACL